MFGRFVKLQMESAVCRVKVIAGVTFKVLLTHLPNAVLGPSMSLQTIGIMRLEAALIAAESFFVRVNK